MDTFDGEINATSESTLKQIAELTREQDELREFYKIDQEQLRKLKEAEDAAKAAYQLAANARAAKQDQLSAAKRKGQEFTEKIERLKREMERLRLLEEEKMFYINWAKQADLDTIGRPWRELAKEHQILGAKKLAFSGSGVLGDGVGLGKSLTSLIYVDILKAKRVLVVAPKDVLLNFENQIRKWAGDRKLFGLVSQTKINRDSIFGVLKNEYLDEYIVTINLEAWRSDPELLQHIKECQFEAIIIDEAHNLKNEKTNAFKGVKEIRYASNLCGMCGKHNIIESTENVNQWGYTGTTTWECLDCGWYTNNQDETFSIKHCLPMTGTLILNSPEEFWPLAYLINRKMFPKAKFFLEDYCEKDSKGKWRFQYGGVKRLTEKIGNMLVMRDRKDAGIVVPPQEEINYHLDFLEEDYPDQFHAYKMLIEEQALILNDDTILDQPRFIQLLTRFRQLMTWPEGIAIKDRYGTVVARSVVKESIKVDKAEQLIKEIVNRGERVVLFSHFTDPLKELHRRLNGIPYEGLEDGDDSVFSSVILDGSTSTAMREQIRLDADRETWGGPDNYKYDIVLANYKVAATGLNFTSITHTIYLDREWNPGKEEQAAGRTQRMGQTEETTVHVIKARSPRLKFNVDDFMDLLFARKSGIVDEFDGGAKSMSAKMIELLRKDLEGS